MTLEKTITAKDMKLVSPPQLTPEQKVQWDAYYNPINEAFLKANPQDKDLVRWRYQRYMHDYLACVKCIDENVGRMLKYLDDEGLSENTIVVYSSDQGFYLGEHGWFDKRWIFEESLRMPLVIRWPGVTKPGGQSKSIVSNLDFGETFLDAAGVKVPDDMQGRSLMPILEGNTPADWRKSFYYHYYEFPQPHVRPHYGVVTDADTSSSATTTPDVDYWELFDREKDPYELKSFYGDPAYADITKELMAELTKLRKDLKVPSEDQKSSPGCTRQTERPGQEGKKSRRSINAKKPEGEKYAIISLLRSEAVAAVHLSRSESIRSFPRPRSHSPRFLNIPKNQSTLPRHTGLRPPHSELHRLLSSFQKFANPRTLA